ncbi:chemotaxis protein CheA [Desulfolutivibrio sp.]|uniref:chemotaxis protein CheA n=1 Tax=Desulfolutivibrio sp. TaxID=2773296 RepID=UPI002F96A7A7
MTMDQAVSTYRDEALELLTELERAILDLEADPGDKERMAACFRAMHTIKGGGAMFGFEEISRFTHEIETTFDMVRNGKLAVTPQLLNATLAAGDHIKALLFVAEGPPPADLLARSEELLTVYRQMLAEIGLAASGGPQTAAKAADAPPPVLDGTDACDLPDAGPPLMYWIHFAPAADLLANGTEPLGLFEELAALGPYRAYAHVQDIPALDDPGHDPEGLHAAYDILLMTCRGENAIRDVFLFVEDSCRLAVIPLVPGRLRGADFEEFLPFFEHMPPGEDQTVAASRLRTLVEGKLRQVEAIRTKGHPKEQAPKQKQDTAPASASLRVDSAKLDALVNMVGELVILQSRLRQAVKGENMAAASDVDEDLERLTDAMRDSALELRMLPIGTVFSVFLRLVRDLSASLGKEAVFVAEGAETELDKTVIDRLKDPLIHIIRNSLDHGIEPPEERTQAGKPPAGRIVLSAGHSGGNVVIRIRDDGRGVDPARIRKKAVERGLLSPDADVPEKELLALLFEPGFSTAEKVSDVSGRGVGMDVVKKNIEAMRGTVDMENVLGQGTTTVITLPLTLAIIDGFNVRVGGESYIVPLTNLRGFQERFLTGQPRQVESIERMGHLIPLVSLRRLFAVPGKQPDYERVVIVEADGEMTGIAVDVVVGRQQAVIKSLDESYRYLKWIAGTTINGDGSISLILDVPRLLRMAREQYERTEEREALT